MVVWSGLGLGLVLTGGDGGLVWLAAQAGLSPRCRVRVSANWWLGLGLVLTGGDGGMVWLGLGLGLVLTGGDGGVVWVRVGVSANWW